MAECKVMMLVVSGRDEAGGGGGGDEAGGGGGGDEAGDGGVGDEAGSGGVGDEVGGGGGDDDGCEHCRLSATHPHFSWILDKGSYRKYSYSNYP